MRKITVYLIIIVLAIIAITSKVKEQIDGSEPNQQNVVKVQSNAETIKNVDLAKMSMF